MSNDETDLTKDELAKMWEDGTPTDVAKARRKLRFSPQAAAAMGKLGDREILELDTGPNPLECPVCHTVGNWRRDEKSPEKILCTNDGTHIMTEISNEEAELAEQLQSMVYKIDNEGLDYFLQNYIDMVPDIIAADSDDKTLRQLAEEASLALTVFEHHAREACAANNVEYDQ